MAPSTKQAVLAARRRTAKMRQPEQDEGAFRDMVALDIPPKGIIATFPIDVELASLPRQKPIPVHEPPDDEDE